MQMTARDWLAIHASRQDVERYQHNPAVSEEVARYRFADAMIAASGRKETAPEREPAFVKPSFDEVRGLFMAKKAPSQEAYKFWHFYESKNWMVGKNKMKNVASAVAGWIERGTQAASPSLWQKKTEIELLEARRNELRNKHSAQTAFGADWDNEEMRAEHARLGKKLEEIKRKL